MVWLDGQGETVVRGEDFTLIVSGGAGDEAVVGLLG